MTADILALWLRADPAEHAQALAGLVESSDLLIVSDGDNFGLVRSHSNLISRFETGTALPLMPAAVA